MFRQGNGIMSRLVATCLLGVALVCTPGCGKSRGTVTGTVKLKDGTPVSAGTIVTFCGSDGRNYPGVVNADGAYTVPDLPIGEAKVTVAAPSAEALALMKGKFEAKPGTTPVPIPPQYKDQKSTKLKLKVEKGNQEFPIALDPQ